MLAAVINTFVFSNMTPQHDRFNQRVWNHLEARVREWAKERGEIFFITGAVIDQNNDEQRDANADKQPIQAGSEVAAPTHFYKIVITDRPNEDMNAIAIVMPHVDASPSRDAARDQHVRDHILTIGEIEGVTGIDFLSDLEAADAASLRALLAVDLW